MTLWLLVASVRKRLRQLFQSGARSSSWLYTTFQGKCFNQRHKACTVPQEGAQSWGSTGLLGFLSRNREPLATKDDRAQLAGMNSLANAVRDLSSSQVWIGERKE